MQLIQHQELTSAAASITFSAIAADWTDLLLKVSSRSTRTGNVDSLFISFNELTTNLSHRRLIGDGSSASSSTASNGQVALVSDNNNTANTFGSTEIYIPNYLSSVAKSVSTDSVSETNATEAYQSIYATLWNATAAITSITLTLGNGNFVSGSSATLYGILAGSDGIVTVS